MGHTLVMDGKGIFEEQKRGRHQQVLAALCLGCAYLPWFTQPSFTRTTAV